MKLQIFLLIALFTIAIAEPSCDIDSMCMGCDATTADKCTHCYNGVVATYGARALVSNACSTKLTAITDCEIYRNTLTAAAAGTYTAGGNYPCWKCSSGNHGRMIITGTTDNSGISSSDTALTSSIAGTASCGTKFQTAALTLMANCYMPIEIESDSAGTASGQMCAITASGTSFAATHPASTPTLTGAAALNATGCDNYIFDLQAQTTHQCFNPTSGHAISSTGIIGVAFTVDTNCRQLSTGNLVCGVCTDAYWFGGATCYLSAKMLVLSAAAFFLAMIM